MVNRSKTRNPRFWARWRAAGAVGYFLEQSSGKPSPARCNHEILVRGEHIALLTGETNEIEQWVRSVASKANARLDWHRLGGRANVLHLGDGQSRHRVLLAVHELSNELKGTVLRIASWNGDD